MLTCLLAGLLCLTACGTAQAAPAPAQQPLLLRLAERELAGATRIVQLPDSVTAEPGAAAPLRARYRIHAALGVPAGPLALYLPGLRAHATIRVNGHVVDDRQGDPLTPLPRSIDIIRLVEIPAEFVHAGDNLLEIDAAAHSGFSVSQLILGPRAVVAQMHRWRVLALVVGPALVAVVIATLALCVLLLWARRRDALYGYFGLSALGLALHNAWSLSPVRPLPGVHNVVWWTTLYTFFVAMLVIYCLRLAGWRWRRFELTLIALPLAAAPLMYAAPAVGGIDVVQEVWLLGLIAMAAIGLAAVARFAWKQRDTESTLLLLAAATSVAFGIRDWLLNRSAEDNNPVYLVPYAGVSFAVLAAWMLIDRFVLASTALEAMNVDLEQRVTAKSAQLVRAVDQMRQAKDSAEAANRSKTTFLAAASHDLRQPVHALGLYMAALVDDTLSSGQQELMLRMKASLAALDSMFDALLDISRIDAGAVVAQQRAFAPAPLLHRLAEEFAPQAADKGLRLSVRIARSTVGRHASSDPLLVERIVRNLLSNAVKYTLEGGVLLSCRLRTARGAARTQSWVIEVWDTGPGIAEADRDQVFDEFFQVGNPERDRAAGLGLGLSIVRRLTLLLGHPLSLFSRVDRGSRFVLELPSSSETPPLPPRDTPPDISLAGLVVAVIDDDPDVRSATQMLLQRWGCHVLAGADAADVVHQLLTAPHRQPQAIVADYRLRAGRTGIEAVAALRAVCGMLPALLVSGDSSPEQLALMKSSGLPCMSKPLRPAHLCQWLARSVAGGTEAVFKPEEVQ